MAQFGCLSLSLHVKTENLDKIHDFENVKPEDDKIELNDEVYSEGEHDFDSNNLNEMHDFEKDEIEINDEVYSEDEKVTGTGKIQNFKNG